MSIYCGVDGAQKKITNLYAGIDGATKEVIELWSNENGAMKKIFAKNKSFRFWNTLENPDTDEEIEFVPNKTYDILIITPGGSGGNGGSNWALYKGGYGGAGASGAVLYVQGLKVDKSTSANIICTSDSYDFTLRVISPTVFGEPRAFDFWARATYATLEGNDGVNAEAFKPNPEDGDTGDSISMSKVECNVSYKNIYQSSGQPSSAIKTYKGQKPRYDFETITFPECIIEPEYIAEAGQDAYYNLNQENICLGCSGGGGREGDGIGGKGAPGGIIIIEEDI